MSIADICLIIILILGAGFFSSSETAYLSLSSLKVRNMVEQRKKGSKIVAKLKGNMDRLLTTVLIGTNLLNSFTSAFITAITIGIFGPGSVKIAPFIVAFILTTFGQIIPKTAAGIYPEKFALLWALPLKILEIIFYPVVRIFEALAAIVVKLAEKIIKPSGQVITEDELKTLIDVGEKEGTIEKDESLMMNQLIKLDDLSVGNIMKSRSEICMINQNATQKELISKFMESGFSIIAVYKDNEEDIKGVVNYKSVLFAEENQAKGYAQRIMEDVLFIPETFSVLDVLNLLRKTEYKFAVVLDEQGKTNGIITIEDIISIVM